MGKCLSAVRKRLGLPAPSVNPRGIAAEGAAPLPPQSVAGAENFRPRAV